MTYEEFKSMTASDQHEYISSKFLAGRYALSRRSLVCGAGINDVSYITQPKIDDRQVSCPAYKVWRDMLRRAYDQKTLKKRPTYAGVTVCDEWHRLSSFVLWWKENQVEGFEIDKDLLGDSRQYGPDSCIFVPQWLNCFLTTSAATRGNHPIGVTYSQRDKIYVAQCHIKTIGRQERVGYFHSAEEAHLAWKARKIELASEFESEINRIDPRLYNRIITIINNAK